MVKDSLGQDRLLLELGEAAKEDSMASIKELLHSCNNEVSGALVLVVDLALPVQDFESKGSI